MSAMKFDHIGLAETSSHWPSLQEEDRITQRFQGNFMIQQLDSITTCNQHDPFLTPFKYGVTASLSTINLTGRKKSSGRDPSGLGIWSWKKFRVQGNVYLRIATFYRPVPQEKRGGLGSVYSQHLTFFNKKNRRICPRQGFIHNIKEEIDKWKAVGTISFSQETSITSS